ncbi:MAG: flagellar basal body rod protein FlgB [Anaeromicrobium sp.]|jgi:flagellar basal-body rod protein FlgB|uniref:flagellar basal body rod protein FlgB n=1 Tax=Anaeromicrobium sp. TaxID=1929132 RepID=UPI0025FB6F14|nr:flagellar basal body rod protein FlgB [Anaeromicrobium sp.]MCT4595574.1 flagellar basal body rod protein FlgB [Anaeromicrobium sp.]
MLEKSLKGINILQKTLDASWARNKTISNNIANADTPNYKREFVEFESVLKNELFKDENIVGTTTNEKHIPINGGIKVTGINPQIKKDMNSTYRKDGNNVNIDVEMANLAKNTIKYNMIAQRISSDFKKMKMLVRDGR